MTTKPFYPPLNIGVLASMTAIRHQLELHPDYFDLPECPYTGDTLENVKAIFASREIEKIVEVEKIVERRIEVAAMAAEGGGKRGAKPKAKASGVAIDDVATEITAIRDELKDMKLNSKALQTGDRIQMLKMRAALVEKLLVMAERVQSVKRMSNFQSTVMGILDDLVDEEIRQEFMKRIEPFAASED